MRRLLRVFTLGVVLLGGPGSSRAAIAYLYDDLGRLVRVIRDDGEAATYHYDAVGNILQITRESGVAQTTTVGSTSAASGFPGVIVPVTVTGGNLAGASVVCTAPGVTVQNVHADLDRMTLEIAISSSAPLGPAACQVQGLDVVALPFSVTSPPPPIFLAGAAVSVALAERATVDNNVMGTLSVAIGQGSAAFETTMVAVAVEPVITSVAPGTGTAGTPSLVLTLTGAGFTGATGVDFFRNNALDGAITVMTFSVNGAGTSATVEIAIAPGAPAATRVIRISTPSGQSTALGTGGNLFTVQ
jgi:YD repeat-containing protein